MAIEPLETRVLLTTFAVDTFVDQNDGVGVGGVSLRDAILAANATAGDDIITLPAGTYTLTLTGTGEDGAITGDLDIHDLALDRSGKLVFVNSLFGCLATTSESHSFTPLWKPPFISRLAAEDRCHLNGLAMGDDGPRYVTAVSETDVVVTDSM